MESYRERQAKIAQRNNDAILVRMQNPNDNLSSFDRELSSFPPRPIIKKDPKAIAQIYGESTEPIG